MLLGFYSALAIPPQEGYAVHDLDIQSMLGVKLNTTNLWTIWDLGFSSDLSMYNFTNKCIPNLNESYVWEMIFE